MLSLYLLVLKLEQLLLLLDLLVGLGLLAIVLLQENGELNHTLLYEEILLPELLLLILKKQLGRLALLLLGLVLLLHLVHLPPLLKEASGW